MSGATFSSQKMLLVWRYSTLFRTVDKSRIQRGQPVKAKPKDPRSNPKDRGAGRNIAKERPRTQIINLSRGSSRLVELCRGSIIRHTKTGINQSICTNNAFSTRDVGNCFEFWTMNTEVFSIANGYSKRKGHFGSDKGVWFRIVERNEIRTKVYILDHFWGIESQNCSEPLVAFEQGKKALPKVPSVLHFQWYKPQIPRSHLVPSGDQTISSFY